MQPCSTCGGGAVDASGFCTQCGSFRGVAQQAGYPGGQYAPGYPVSGQPGPGQPYGYPATTPMSGPPGNPYQPGQAGVPGYGPASAPPSAVPPGYGLAGVAPSSVPPGYGPASAPPSSAYPGYLSPAQPPAKRSWLVPLLVGGIAVAVLLAAIIVVVVVKSNSSHPPIADPSSHRPSATPSKSYLVDPCLIGTWQVTSEQMTVDFGTTYGEVDLTLTDKYTVKLREDGTAVEDYGSKIEFDATSGGHDFSWLQNGSISYDYRTEDGTMNFTGSVPDGKYAAYVDNDKVDEGTNTFTYNNMSYSCSGDSLTRQAEGKDKVIDKMRMIRLSHTA